MSNISLCLTSQGSDIRTSIYPPIRLDPDKHHEIALIRLETYNSIPNVNESNNIFRYKFNDTIYNIEILPGAYELSEINDFIQRNLVDGASLEIIPNNNTLKCNIRINVSSTEGAGRSGSEAPRATSSRPIGNVSVIFDHERSMKDLLGYPEHTLLEVPGDYEGSNIVKILAVNQIHVNCNIVDGSFVNGSKAPVLYSFFPNVPPGYKVIESLNENIYLPVSQTYIESIRVWLTDQDRNPINLRGEDLSVWLVIRTL